MKAYKGFDKNMRCRGFQYAEGRTYEEPEAVLCEKGFHACTAPIDVLNYYAPGNGSIYREVELEGVQCEQDGDSKVCAKKITIGAELGIAGLVKAQIEYVKMISGFDANIKKDKTTTGYQDAACATGYQGAACATGDQGAACATGYQGAASATGNQGAACATGVRGAACATGIQGAACATGNQGAACATGVRGAACATGIQGAACATGNQGAACATGYQGAACATGYQGAASAVGDWGAASAMGRHGVAMASGLGGKVKGSLGCALFTVEHGNFGEILSVAAAIVDGESIKPNTWYACEGGKLVEVER